MNIDIVVVNILNVVVDEYHDGYGKYHHHNVNDHQCYCEYPPDLKVSLKQVEQPSHGHLSEVCPGVWTRVSGPLNICCYSYMTGYTLL